MTHSGFVNLIAVYSLTRRPESRRVSTFRSGHISNVWRVLSPFGGQTTLFPALCNVSRRQQLRIRVVEART